MKKGEIRILFPIITHDKEAATTQSRDVPDLFFRHYIPDILYADREFDHITFYWTD